jgi:CheY-like chemotaxis protein
MWASTVKSGNAMTFENAVSPAVEHDNPKTLTKRLMPLSGVRVLIVEDEIIQAMALKDIIADLGGSVPAISNQFEQAIEAVDRGGQFDCAILDINLNGTLSFPIADLLLRRPSPAQRSVCMSTARA